MSDQLPMFILQSIAVFGLVGALFIRAWRARFRVPSAFLMPASQSMKQKRTGKDETVLCNRTEGY